MSLGFTVLTLLLSIKLNHLTLRRALQVWLLDRDPQSNCQSFTSGFTFELAFGGNLSFLQMGVTATVVQ